MNKIKFLSILVGLLIALNIVVLSFLFVGERGPHDRPDKGPKISIYEKFAFTDNQKELFDISRAKHMEQSKNLARQLEDISIAYYRIKADNQVKDSLYSSIVSISQKIYEANDNHFNEIRKICTVDQLPEMDEFIKGLIRGKGHRGNRRKEMRH